EGDDRVADEVREDDVRLRRPDLVDRGAELCGAERGVFLGDRLAAILREVCLHLPVRLLRIDVVRSDEVELRPDLLDEPRHEVAQLLVRYRSRVEAVIAALLCLVESRIKQDAVVFLEHRKHRLPTRRGVAPENRSNLILQDEVAAVLGSYTSASRQS